MLCPSSHDLSNLSQKKVSLHYALSFKLNEPDVSFSVGMKFKTVGFCSNAPAGPIRRLQRILYGLHLTRTLLGYGQRASPPERP